MASAPDCVTKAMSPAGGVRCAKLALMPAAGEMKPRQFGPTIRRRCGLAADEHVLAERHARLLFARAEAGADHDRRAAAARAELRHEAGNDSGGRGDDGEVGRDRQLVDGGVVQRRADRLLMRIDR